MLRTEAMFELLVLKAKVEKNLFLVSLIGTTIQDGDKRERRNVVNDSIFIKIYIFTKYVYY